MITLQFQTASHIFGHFEVESLRMLVVLLDGPLRAFVRGLEQSIAGDGEILRNMHLSNVDLFNNIMLLVKFYFNINAFKVSVSPASTWCP